MPSTESGEDVKKEKFWIKMREMRMDHWYPMHSAPWVISAMVLVAAVFIPLGALVLIASDRVKEVQIPYQGVDGNPPCTWDRKVSLSGPNPDPWDVVDHCKTNVTFEITETITAPVFLYYKLTSYNQNFRYLVRSRSDEQLQGGGSCSCEDATACPPYITYGQQSQQGHYIVNFTNGTPESRDMASWNLLPCGQIAYTFFNDTYNLYQVVGQSPGTLSLVCNTSDFDHKGTPLGGSNVDGNTVANNCEKSDIAWSGDRKVRFKGFDRSDGTITHEGIENVEHVTDDTGKTVPRGGEYLTNGYYWREWGHRIPRQDDYDFMVWSRPASVPNFKKLHRKITRDLTPGNYTIEVQDRYDTSSFGDKKIILASRTWVGADNTVLGATYCAVGTLAFLLAIGITIGHTMFPMGGYTPQAMRSLEGNEAKD
eukprot:TRINITY_DN8874_c2_g1_i1.p1 TRINITY_DN8874_c2_g1~~TRINITY_DN8874_c2_g1_i1.p1  ORF type:complete len:443 (+),score=75.85 TRINITY_DN8874_c2_g1_i1:55-1329(+)